MSTTLQSFLSRAIVKAADDLATAFERMPDDKRDWSAMGGSRSALDQVAECAMLNGSTCNLLADQTWPTEFDFEKYMTDKRKLAAKGWDVIKPMLLENSARVAKAVDNLDSAALDNPVDMPWGPMTVAQIASYPFWNMCYHEGQINYIASMLGCLD